ncbi:hypothetical protein [Leptospira terpstrae]|uniref:Uncharacterized protein n=1 Tax=Leptospira terpstrae serovar Hualin str. LT 11-33 = ATCC 700639 TaxID=1257025 RepID=N1VUJ0_9LEPT|nr:hypothetical protein [Leptospira terpstrae]EMY60680.1 hypothetical protein LEP1GSC203_0322 [Leptospira terpstrae serovar Hualin str. LT 11-33 = ATCC 700639]
MKQYLIKNRISFLLTLDINNAAPLVCYGYEAYLNYHQQEIESFHKLANFDFSSEYNINFISKFKIQNNILKEIESKRDKDIEFALKVDFFLIQKEYVNIQNKNNIDLLKSYPQLISTTLIIKFPQSFWIENIINKSTLHKIALLELPLADYPKLDTLSISIKELREARKYFINGDYDKVVSHCRSVLESVTNQKLKVNQTIRHLLISML